MSLFRFEVEVRLVLASASPRRADLLRSAGFDFLIEPVDIDESLHDGEPARSYVLRLARAKAETAARRHTDAVVIGADTAVVVDESILVKPASDADAERMLTLLSGRTHEVVTGICVWQMGLAATSVETTRVGFRPLSSAEIAAYVATGEPGDKAGAYAIQGGASRFVEQIEGSYSNVVGLPIERLVELLRQGGVIASRRV